MKLTWTKGEVKKLFSMVEECKKKHEPLILAFNTFSQRFCRKVFSVRNFYYHKLREFEKNPQLARSFNIDISLHQKMEQRAFSQEEYDNELATVARLVDSGYSIRKACQEVSKGDLKFMLRLQNKFYSTKKFEEKNIEKIVKNMKLKKLQDRLAVEIEKDIKNSENNTFSENNKNIKKINEKTNKNQIKSEYFNNYLKNKYNFETNKKFENKKEIVESSKKQGGEVVVMPKKKTALSDSEINSLFLGLVKLVKKAAEESAEASSLQEAKSANKSLREAIVALAEKEREVEILRQKFEVVKNEKEKLKEKLQNFTCEKILED